MKKYNLFQRFFCKKMIADMKAVTETNHELSLRLNLVEKKLMHESQKAQSLELKVGALEHNRKKLGEKNSDLVEKVLEIKTELEKKEKKIHQLNHDAAARDQAHEQEIKKIRIDAEMPKKALGDMWSFIESKELTGEFQEMLRKNKENETTED